ncbi:uncharacterized protein LOC114749870 [Rhizophagus irregularis DAOM 181602=DAOM 197198]|nr:uncharacterized protein LOC114749870 [Rhizophagus irregularis DAOM 181602=DAOM 197198]
MCFAHNLPFIITLLKCLSFSANYLSIHTNPRLICLFLILDNYIWRLNFIIFSCLIFGRLQRLMNRILQEYLGKFVAVYLDDVIIYSKGTLEQHLDHLRQVFETLR